jgi:predicted DNA-binding transcriptional regulator AlpA
VLRLTMSDWDLWTVAEVRAHLKCSRSTLYRHMERPDFPKAVRPGGGHPRWLESEIRARALRREYPEAA